MKQFAAYVYFNDLRQGNYVIDGIEVQTMLLNHPGYCLGYRVNYNGRSVCYITDQELFPKDCPHYSEHYQKQITEFVSGADALITDCTYFQEEYKSHVGWGHSNINEVGALAHAAGVKTLYLFHHDPDQNDAEIDRKLEVVNGLLAELKSDTQCIAPSEELAVKL